MKLLIDHWRDWATEQLMALVGTGLPNRPDYRRFLDRMTIGEFSREYREAMTDADKANDPYTVIGNNYISVCANCFPGNTILDFFPDLAGCQISHGICSGHKRRFMLELNLRSLRASHTETTTEAAPVEQEVGVL